MRLMIDGGGYATAATAFRDANHVAAMQYDALTGKLAGYAAMAGDDATSTDFAAAYDEAAAEAVGALADLVDAFANLGHLTAQSLANHLRAENDSIINGATVYEGDTLGHDYASVLPAVPPSSLGGDPPFLPAQAAWVLDQVEGFTWPNADTARLRDAAHTWRSAAEGLESLTDYCRGAIRSFEDQQSPEIPLAVEATSQLRRTVLDLADQYAALAAACETYAADVEEKRAQLQALLAEVLAMVVEGVVISAAIGMITAGAGAAAGTAAVIARVIAQAPRFLAILTALRSLALGTAASIRAARASVVAARSRLQRFVGSRIALRTEAGQLGHSGSRLLRHERSGSHSVAIHVGKKPGDLIERLKTFPDVPMASSFRSLSEADRIIEHVLRRRRTEIEAWLAGGSRPLRLDEVMSAPTGISVRRGGGILEVTGVRVVLIHDRGMPEGYRILTSFPQP